MAVRDWDSAPTSNYDCPLLAGRKRARTSAERERVAELEAEFGDLLEDEVGRELAAEDFEKASVPV